MNTISKLSIVVAIAFATALTVGTAACSDFLDEQSMVAFTEETAYGDLSSVAVVVDGIYRTFASDTRGGDAGLLAQLGSDESQQGAGQYGGADDPGQPGYDRYEGLIATSTRNSNFWKKHWQIIVPSAKVLALLPQFEDEDPETARRLMGEAHFFRGLATFYLSMYWGRVPIVDITPEATVSGGGRQALPDVWKYIFSDLQYAADNLPAGNAAEPKRATSGAALAMLGKAYMSAPEETGLRDFDKAKACFEQIMDGRYSLLPQFSALFLNDNKAIPYIPNSNEAIFEIQYNNTDLYNRYMWEFGTRAATEYLDLEGPDPTIKVNDGAYIAGYDLHIPTAYTRNDTEGHNPMGAQEGVPGIWEAGDERREVSVRYDLTWHGQTPRPSGWSGAGDETWPHVRKYEDYRTDKYCDLPDAAPIRRTWYSGKNFPMIRYADVLLLYAECLNELGDGTGAVTYVNQVRDRAFGGAQPAGLPWSTMSQDEFREKIMDERSRELCFESWRRVDLIRTGQITRRVCKYNRWAKAQWGEAGFPAARILYPIPQDEINSNDDIASDPEAQNPGY